MNELDAALLFAMCAVLMSNAFYNENKPSVFRWAFLFFFIYAMIKSFVFLVAWFAR